MRKIYQKKCKNFFLKTNLFFRIISNDIIDSMEQKKINETTEKISKMVVKISGRIIALQQHVKELKNISKSVNNAQEKFLKEIISKEKTKNLNEKLVANQCAIMIDKVMSISVVSPMWKNNDTNEEDNLNETRANLSCLMLVKIFLIKNFTFKKDII